LSASSAVKDQQSDNKLSRFALHHEYGPATIADVAWFDVPDLIA